MLSLDTRQLISGLTVVKSRITKVIRCLTVVIGSDKCSKELSG